MLRLQWVDCIKTHQQFSSDVRSIFATFNHCIAATRVQPVLNRNTVLTFVTKSVTAAHEQTGRYDGNVLLKLLVYQTKTAVGCWRQGPFRSEKRECLLLDPTGTFPPHLELLLYSIISHCPSDAFLHQNSIWIQMTRIITNSPEGGFWCYCQEFLL